MSDLLPLHRGCRKPGILKNAKKAHDGRNHCNQPEILWHEQPGDYHDVRQV